MLSTRYTIVIADRQSGVVRRFTIGLRPALTTVFTTLALPILIGLGARWSATAEIDRLRAGTTDLQVENASFRAATGELTTQIGSLETVIAELSERSTIDPQTRAAIEKLPALVKARALGGSFEALSPLPKQSLSIPSPEDTFGVLRDLLVNLEGRLQIARTDVERRGALADATPSIWPAVGWLTSGFGNRLDPFNGGRQFHFGLDIAADRGQPVYATADGTVESAARNGDYGNLVVVNHEFGLQTRYAHLSGYAVREGDSVKRGDLVGYVGATGRSTSTHLHYEVWVNGRPINPLNLLASRPTE